MFGRETRLPVNTTTRASGSSGNADHDSGIYLDMLENALFRAHEAALSNNDRDHERVRRRDEDKEIVCNTTEFTL
ncbi:uncharacterized protein VTP21DRAFT_5340 [Calcarisporiella thermophila]|uniref:uncharacterized protein n=1 Tax=Calcarisporiella thermophila TaxID=911321 RepID=UPI003744ADA7